MMKHYLYSKATGVLIFIIFELMVIGSNCFPFFLLDHRRLHIIFTICFVLYHLLLCIIVKQESWLTFLFVYWMITFLLQLYVELFFFGPMFIRILHPFCVSISYFFPGPMMLYFPGAVRFDGFSFQNIIIFMFLISMMFFFIYAKKLKHSKSH